MLSSSTKITGILLSVSVLCGQLGLSSAARVTQKASSQKTENAYNEFRNIHRKGGDTGDTVGYAERHTIFQAWTAEVHAHNAQNLSWTKAVNRFADFTPAEKRAMMGYKRVGGRWAQSSGGPSFLQVGHSDVHSIDVSSLAKTVDWTSKMRHSNFVHNQGDCGSCWAHAAVSALEAHAELATGKGYELATQEIISCTENPRHCGGTGGCHGATAELAFEHARKHGISQKHSYTGGCSKAAPGALKVESFVRLPENKASHLLSALANHGPVALSIDAANFFSYNDGVFAGCKQDTIVNHAVLGVGYGSDAKSGKDYWMIKNSWGANWGERGYIRVERFNEDDAYCGTDVKPQDGVFCEDAPATVKVCGMCGVTSDSSYPVISPRAAGQHTPKLSKVKLFSVP